MAFPHQRMRRLRMHPALRRMLRETVLSVNDFICPLFVMHGRGQKIAVASMPGVYQLSCDQLKDEVLEIRDLGIPAVILFGIPAIKDPCGSASWQADGVVQQAVAEIKHRAPELLVITDVCLCGYTDHGHCGLVDSDGIIRNDRTLELLARQALSHARAGADMVAPSDMMDGRVGAIRAALDCESYEHIPIMAYAAKYRSAFYGPFREAAQSAPRFGDRSTYQMDPANRAEALREVALDIEEGADIVMVKPALAYLDVIREVKQHFGCPTAAYNVSGEYAMVQAASERGWLDEISVQMEILTAIKRAGADMIITYAARQAAMLVRSDTGP